MAGQTKLNLLILHPVIHNSPLAAVKFEGSLYMFLWIIHLCAPSILWCAPNGGIPGIWQWCRPSNNLIIWLPLYRDIEKYEKLCCHRYSCEYFELSWSPAHETLAYLQLNNCPTTFLENLGVHFDMFCRSCQNGNLYWIFYRCSICGHFYYSTLKGHTQLLGPGFNRIWQAVLPKLHPS